MKEFCVDCINKQNGTDKTPSDYILFPIRKRCRGCGKRKYVVIMDRHTYTESYKKVWYDENTKSL